MKKFRQFIQNQMSKLQRYQTGYICHCCVWINQQYNLLPKNVKIPNVGAPIWTDSNTSVFNVCNKFENTLEIVLGAKGKKDIHNTTSLDVLLAGITNFLVFLEEKHEIKDVRVMVNSHDDSKDSNNRRMRYGGKEHTHAMITMNSEDSIQKFNEVWHPDSSEKTTVVDRSYKDDFTCELDENQCSLIVQGTSMKRLSDYVGIDTIKQSFYLFMQFHNAAPVRGIVGY
jgi:hypothetical protein